MPTSRRAWALKIGDTLTLNILGRDIEATIFNLRDVDFRTGGINFLNIMSPGIIDQAPHSFLATVRADPADEEPMFAAISRAFPNITVVRVKETLAQVGEMLAALARGVSVASLITILAGVLVLAGAIAAGHRARLYDAVVLKVLGATRARLGAVYVIEYGAPGNSRGPRRARRGNRGGVVGCLFRARHPVRLCREGGCISRSSVERWEHSCSVWLAVSPRFPPSPRHG